MNSELQTLFRADQDERTNHPDYGTPEYWALRGRDTERWKRLQSIVESGGLKEPEDYYYAAWILKSRRECRRNLAGSHFGEEGG
jgi:hypothetical protein